MNCIVSEIVKMWSDDVIYALLLFISLPIGQLIKTADSPRKRQVVSTIVGLIMVTVVCGLDALHSFFSAFINCVILKFVSPRSVITY